MGGTRGTTCVFGSKEVQCAKRVRRNSSTGAPDSISPALVSGSVLPIVAYATFRLFGYVEVFETTLEATYLFVAEHIKLVVLGLFRKSARDGEQAGGTGDGGISLVDAPFLVAKGSQVA